MPTLQYVNRILATFRTEMMPRAARAQADESRRFLGHCLHVQGGGGGGRGEGGGGRRGRVLPCEGEAGSWPAYKSSIIAKQSLHGYHNLAHQHQQHVEK